MKQEYTVWVQEVWSREIIVEAESPDEARKIANREAARGNQGRLSFEYTIDVDQWDVALIKTK